MITSKDLKFVFDGCKVQSLSGRKNGAKIVHFIRVTNYEFDEATRLAALNVIYGDKWTSGSVGGNITKTSMSMSPVEWSKLLQVLNVYTK